MKKRTLLVAMSLCALAPVLASCGGTKEAKLLETIVAYHSEAREIAGNVSDYHWVDTIYTYDDNSYKLVTAAAIMSSGTNADMAACSVISYGSYEYGVAEDGLQSLYLSTASKCHFAMNVYNNMFSRQIDSETSFVDGADPVKYVGDDVTVISKDTFMKDYGYARLYSVYLDANDNRQCDALYIGEVDAKASTVTNFTQPTFDEVLVAYNKEEIEMGGAISDYHWVDTIELNTKSNSYELIESAAICANTTNYSTAGASVTTKGTFKFGTAEDGVQAIHLSEATSIDYSMNVYNNMFARHIDLDTSFVDGADPVKYVGDDVTVISKAQFMDDYGYAKHYDAYLNTNDARLCTAKYIDED